MNLTDEYQSLQTYSLLVGTAGDHTKCQFGDLLPRGDNGRRDWSADAQQSLTESQINHWIADLETLKGYADKAILALCKISALTEQTAAEDAMEALEAERRLAAR